MAKATSIPMQYMYKKILVPLDGSEMAEKALPYAALIAKSLDGEITVLSVADENKKSEKRLSDYLYEQAQKLKTSGIEAVSLVTCGDAASEILDFSEKNGVQLIIMSAHGGSGISRWAVGSVSNKVMRESYVPLLLIKTGAVPTTSNRNGIRRILVSLDGSKLSEEAIPYAIGMGNKLDSEIVLIRVNEAVELSAYVSSEFVSGWNRHHQQAISGMQSGIQKYLGKVEDILRSQGLRVRSKIASGKAAQEIISYVESNDIDLLAMTTHGQSGYGHWAYGSVTEKVIHGISKPVLLLRTKPSVLDSGI